jgi:rhamnogalacturonyl hydrolase YesR
LLEASGLQYINNLPKARKDGVLGIIEGLMLKTSVLFDKQLVFNASLKGARLLAQCYSMNRNAEATQLGHKAIAYVMKNQREDGAWIYSKDKAEGWVDNYHTGYVLDCADEYSNLTKDETFLNNIDKGFNYHKANFFQIDGMPKFYDKNPFPVDCTSASQSLLTLVRFGDLELAEKVATWMINNMQDKQGYFYFRKFESHSEHQSFMRWSDAWMFAVLATLVSKIDIDE